MILMRSLRCKPRKDRSLWLLSLLLVVTAMALAWGPIPHVDARRFNHNQNGLWLGHRWFDGHATGTEVRTLCRQMQQSGIRDLYVHVGPMDASGHIPHWDAAVWHGTLQSIRDAMPGTQVYAWLGGVTTDAYGIAPDTLDLGAIKVRKAMVATARSLVEDGDFDGIHYDLEMVPNDNLGFLYLLDATRRCLPRSLSVAAPIIHPPLLPVKSLWTLGYFRKVAERCDQIAVMAYDTVMPTETLYKRMLAWQVSEACDAVSGTACQLSFGVPTYKEQTPAHNPSAEHLTAALDGIAWGLEQSHAAQSFHGVAVYAEWTTQPQEWRELAEFGSSR